MKLNLEFSNFKEKIIQCKLIKYFELEIYINESEIYIISKNLMEPFKIKFQQTDEFIEGKIIMKTKTYVHLLLHLLFFILGIYFKIFALNIIFILSCFVLIHMYKRKQYQLECIVNNLL